MSDSLHPDPSGAPAEPGAPASAGQILRQAREAQGLSIERLAGQLKVSASKLEALEDGRYEVFPDAAFLRALAMTLCRTLKVDAAPVLATLPKARPVSLGASDPGAVPFDESKGRLRLNLDGGVKSGRSLGDAFSPQWLAPVGLLAAAAVIWFWPRDVHWPDAALTPVASAPAAPASEEGAGTPMGQVQMVAETPESASASAPASAPSPAASAALLAASAVPAPPAAPAVAAVAAVATPATPSVVAPVVAVPAPVAASAALAPITRPARAEFAASAASWIEVRDGRGVRLLFRTVNPGESLSLEGEAPLSVRLGNAQATTVRFKGQSIDLVPLTQGNVARFELK